MVVGGEVGEGMFGDGYDGDTELDIEPFKAERCEDDSTALSAALAGSSVCSTIERSWAVWRCDGEVVFGAGPSIIFLVEYCRFRLLGGPAVDGVGTGGGIVASYTPLLLTFGKGC